MPEYEQAVFISYAWGGEREEIVNQIDESLQKREIRIIRDKRALGYRGSIKEFMERIGQGNCVIVVISDKYLRSSNCMFELVEIAENKQLHDRVFPIVLSDANIYDPLKRIEYVKYWEAKRTELARAMKKLDPANLQGIRDDMDQYDRIRDKISGITSILKDMNTLTPEMHRDSEFSELYDAIVKRVKKGTASSAAESDGMAKKVEEEDKRELLEEADSMAAQKAEIEHLAKQITDEELAVKTKSETQRKSKEESDRPAAQKAEREAKTEADRKVKAIPVEMKAESASTAPAQKKPVSKRLVIGIIAVVVFIIAGIGFSAIFKRGNGNSSIFNPPEHVSIPGPITLNMLSVSEVRQLYEVTKSFRTLAEDVYGDQYSDMLNNRTPFNLENSNLEPLKLHIGWCSLTQTILEENLTNIDFILKFNGQRISNDKIAHIDETNTDGTVCRIYFSVIDNWASGRYSVSNTMESKIKINDGQDNYEAGILGGYEYIITIP